MTTEQKLKLFSQTALSTAENKKDRILSEYEAQLVQEFKEKKERLYSELEFEYSQKELHLKQEKKQLLSNLKNHLRQELSNKTEQLISKLFDDVTTELNLYKSTTKYAALLEHQIEYVKTLSNDSRSEFYIDSSDEALREYLEKKCNVSITISNEYLYGGILAKLPEKNLLVDETFITKIADVRDTFVLTL